jgi:hypothetical protein
VMMYVSFVFYKLVNSDWEDLSYFMNLFL